MGFFSSKMERRFRLFHTSILGSLYQKDMEGILLRMFTFSLLFFLSWKRSDETGI